MWLLIDKSLPSLYLKFYPYFPLWNRAYANKMIKIKFSTQAQKPVPYQPEKEAVFHLVFKWEMWRDPVKYLFYPGFIQKIVT